MFLKKKIGLVFVSFFLISLIGISSNPILTSTSSVESTSSINEVNELQNPSGASSLPSELIFCGVFPIVQRPDAGPDRRDGFFIAVDEINSQIGADRILPTGVNMVEL
jgi:hypothetical protein